MKGFVPFHFIVLATGRVLEIYDYVTPEKLQSYIMKDEMFAIRPPLGECKLALYLMENVGYLRKNGKEYYRQDG